MLKKQTLPSFDQLYDEFIKNFLSRKYPIGIAKTLSGATIRQISYWEEKKYIDSEEEGNHSIFSIDSIIHARLIVRYLNYGYLLEKAIAKTSNWKFDLSGITYQMVLDDFLKNSLKNFKVGMGISSELANISLRQIYHWTEKGYISADESHENSVKHYDFATIFQTFVIKKLLENMSLVEASVKSKSYVVEFVNLLNSVKELIIGEETTLTGNQKLLCAYLMSYLLSRRNAQVSIFTTNELNMIMAKSLNMLIQLGAVSVVEGKGYRLSDKVRRAVVKLGL